MTTHLRRDTTSRENAVRAFAPQSLAAGTLNGASVDTKPVTGGPMPSSAKLFLSNGAATGTPDSYTLTPTVQDSADGSSWDAVASGAAVTAIAANNTDREIDIDLLRLRRYVRVVVVAAYTGGTSPACPVSGTWVLGGYDRIPHGG